MPINLQDYGKQIQQYKELRPTYKGFAEGMRKLLTALAEPICPSVIVQARAKSVKSFADKVWLREIRKKKPPYKDPLKEITDLCAARVITHTKKEVEAVGKRIRDKFRIVEGLDKVKLLQPAEFGYRSHHFVVSLREDVKYTQMGLEAIPDSWRDLKAEIQVRTIVQHAWADIGHDRIYKGEMTPTDTLRREVAKLAAQLEAVDDAFGQMVAGIDVLRGSAGRRLDVEDLQRELARLHILKQHLDRDGELDHRIARLSLSLGKYGEVAQMNVPATDAWTAPLHTCRAIAAVCEKGDGGPAADKRSRACDELKEAISRDVEFVEAHVRWAELCLKENPSDALQRAKLAFELAPLDPDALSCYVRLRLVVTGDGDFIPLLQPTIKKVSEECRRQAELGFNPPWSFYQLGEMLCLLGGDEELDGMEALIQAVQKSPVPAPIEEAITRQKHYLSVPDAVPAAQPALQLLMLGMATRPFGSRTKDPTFTRTKSACVNQLDGPAVIVAGGCDPSVQPRMEEYNSLLDAAFGHYKGTIFSGGTVQGIPGIVGRLAKESKGRIRALSYLPAQMPTDRTAVKDTRYEFHTTTGGKGFTAREPLQNWIDLFASDIDPAEVSVLGINGGKIAAFEYKLALMLGASVGLIRDSGREADQLQRASEEQDIPGLLLLPGDPMAVRAFVMHWLPAELKPETRDRLARQFHGHYVQQRKTQLQADDRGLAAWEKLTGENQDSNRRKVDYYIHALAALGLCAVQAEERKIKLYEFNDDQVEFLVKTEHGRYVAERLRAGWRPGPRNELQRQRESLVGWDELSDDNKRRLREEVRLIPGLLAAAGFEIQERATHNGANS